MMSLQPVEIKENVWWVANRSDSLLEVNVYLLTKPYKDGRVNLMFDPGPQQIIQLLEKAVQPIIGGLRNVHAVLINHQDPDVAPNSAYIQKLNPRCMVVASEDTWRLIRFFGLKESRFKSVESYRTAKVVLPGGSQIAFVHTPFCHFRGSMMYYDVDSRILFSGDLFGGLSYSQDLYATESSWEGIKTFHQLYMPSREALQLAISRIRNLDPQPVMIAPQHGSIIGEELVQDFLDRLYNLEVGLDLLKHREKEENYLGAINEVLEGLREDPSFTSLDQNLERWNEDGSFTNVATIKNGQVTAFKADPATAFKTLIDWLREEAGSNGESLISLVTLKSLIGRNIPVGDILPPATEEDDLPDYFE
jgi:glyoxylase-like metal-dependent hydrolase (beta-lactamase superfamily II)